MHETASRVPTQTGQPMTFHIFPVAWRVQLPKAQLPQTRRRLLFCPCLWQICFWMTRASPQSVLQMMAKYAVGDIVPSKQGIICSPFPYSIQKSPLNNHKCSARMKLYYNRKRMQMIICTINFSIQVWKKQWKRIPTLPFIGFVWARNRSIYCRAPRSAQYNTFDTAKMRCSWSAATLNKH